MHSMVLLGFISVLFGLASIAAGAFDVVRAINPAWLAQFSPQIYALPGLIPAIVLAIVTIILVIICRSIAKGRTRKKYGTSGAIVSAIFGILLAVVALVVTNLFPDGVISSNSSDAKLATDSSLAQGTLEKAAGSCSSGWTTVDTADYPGVTQVFYCASNQTAFAGFSNPTAANLYRMPLQSKALSIIKSKLTSEQIAQLPEFESLSGSQWIAVAPSSVIDSLQGQIGGTSARVNTAE